MPTTYQWQEFPYDLPGTSYGATSVEEPDNSPVLSVSSDEDTDLTGPMLVSVSVKIICPDEKRTDHKTFMLHDLDVNKVKTMALFRNELHRQFGDTVVDRDRDFNFGLYKGTKRIWVRSYCDFQELIQLLKTKSTTLVWCEGLSKKHKKKHEDLSGSDEEACKPRKKRKSSNEDTLDRIDDIIDELREKHKHTYNNLQYRVWAETMVAGRHDSLETAPKGTFFKRSKVLSAQNSQVLSAHNSPVNMSKVPTVITPVKAAELKTMYISQIKELHSLLEIGALSNDDFQKQKSNILDLMNNL